MTISETGIQAALADEEFMEAIYLASPALHGECGKWRRGELKEERKITRLRYTLTRYYARFTSRCTPFGLFAGCSVAHWGIRSQLEPRSDRNVRHTRLDMHYLCALAQHLASWPEVRASLQYRLNTSLYRLGAEFRYVERQYTSGDCAHQICALEASDFLVQVLALAQPGRTLAELAAGVLENAADAQEIMAFLDELVNAQVLVSELEPTVTGNEFFQHLRQVLRLLVSPAAATVRLAQAVQALDEVQRALALLDEPGQNAAADYERISALLAPLGVLPEVGKLFQTDIMHGLFGTDGAVATLDQSLQGPLEEALAVLALLAPSPGNPRLENFTRRFQARYEDQEVSLLEALDAESGLAYTDYGKSRYSALVHDLVLPAPPPPPRPSERSVAQQWLHQRVQEAGRTQQYALDITYPELQAHGLLPNESPLPPSVGVMFRLFDAERIVIEGVGGSSAVNMLGRFSHAAPEIERLVEELTQHEQAHNPEVCFAEISHLPASRVGNLLQRPHCRAFEIPYLAHSTRPQKQQLPVQELTLAVRNGQLVLRSSRTRDRVVPRLSTAHNFGGDALPVYQLLCDLQTQGLQSQLGISWEAIAPEAKFTPRLTCGRVVLVPASWRLRPADYQELLAATPPAIALTFAAFRSALQLPRFFTLAEGDNELLVDADNEWLVRVWLDTIRLLPNIVLKEFLFEAAASPVRDAEARPYVTQCVALLVRQLPVYAGPPAVETVLSPAEAVRREFAPGSEWLYYKLYCGQVVADRILLEVLRPLAAEMANQGLVDNWFFVRYDDPDPHLRVRWHLTNPDRIGTVMRLVGEYLVPVSSNHLVWKTQIDTYRRELERYGHRSMTSAEALFGYQTQVLLERMARAATDDFLGELWLWGLSAIDELLAAFGYSLERKLAWAASLRAAFAQEFGETKEVKKQLDTKYRVQRAALHQVLGAATQGTRPLPIALVAIAQEVLALNTRGLLEVPLDDLLGSYAHMLLNRLLPSEPRLHELVLYDFLHRHYRTCQARALAATSCRS